MSKAHRSFAVASLALVLLAAGSGLLPAQEIISNGTFNTNVANWALDPGVGTFSWSSDQALLLVNNANPPGQTASVSQCGAITGGGVYDLGARVQPINFSGAPNVSEPGPRRVEHTGSMYVLLDFYPLDNCRGSALSQFVRISAGGANLKWESIGQTFQAPAGAASVLTSLAISKDQAASDVQGEFDDVSILPSAPPKPPSANFAYFPTTPAIGQLVSFIDQSTNSPTSWSWNFDDPASGGNNASTIQNPVHTFKAAGTYSVSLVASNLGGSGTRTQSVIVVVAPPVANFTFAPTSPLAGQTVQLTDSSSNTPTSWAWNFGDPNSGAANTSALQNPTHVFAAPGVYPISLTAGNVGGSGSRNHAVTVVAGPPVASFTFTPPSPSPGQNVQFTDTSTGSPTSWSWNFGDPGSGGANTSTVQNPTHAFGAPGVYTVGLTAGNTSGSSSTSAQVTVTAGVVNLPVAGHVAGVGGTIFVTDAHVENPNAATVAANLVFFPVGGGPSGQTTFSLGPLETRTLPDVVANQFGVTNSFGALRLSTAGSSSALSGTLSMDALESGLAPLRMTSRTYDVVGSGSFGMAISGVAAAPASTASRTVTGLQRNDQFRSNLGAVNDSTSEEDFVIVLRGTDGAVLGTSLVIALPPSGQWQLGVKDLFPTVSGNALTAEFQSSGGSAVPVAYGTLADNQSGDLTYFPSLRPASQALLPVISRVTGVGGAVFASDLTIANVSDTPANVTLTFWEHDKDNSVGARQASLTLAARETRLTADALGALFGLSETFGALNVESDGSLAVAERIWTQSPTTAGTVGQQVDPIVPGAMYSKASILGLRQDSAFRSNTGFVNPNDTAAPIALTLRRPDGTVIGTASVTIPAHGFEQFSLAGLFPSAVFPPGESLTVALDAGALQVCAYGIIADNVSQDLTSSPALP